MVMYIPGSALSSIDVIWLYIVFISGVVTCTTLFITLMYILYTIDLLCMPIPWYWYACTSQCMHAQRMHAKLAVHVIVHII